MQVVIKKDAEGKFTWEIQEFNSVVCRSTVNFRDIFDARRSFKAFRDAVWHANTIVDKKEIKT